MSVYYIIYIYISMPLCWDSHHGMPPWTSKVIWSLGPVMEWSPLQILYTTWLCILLGDTEISISLWDGVTMHHILSPSILFYPQRARNVICHCFFLCFFMFFLDLDIYIYMILPNIAIFLSPWETTRMIGTCGWPWRLLSSGEMTPLSCETYFSWGEILDL